MQQLSDTLAVVLNLCSMAASFYASPLIGATTTLACFAHEIPHEIADYSILIRSGFTKRQAMQSQFVTAIGAFVCGFLTCTMNVDSHTFRLGKQFSEGHTAPESG